MLSNVKVAVFCNYYANNKQFNVVNLQIYLMKENSYGGIKRLYRKFE